MSRASEKANEQQLKPCPKCSTARRVLAPKRVMLPIAEREDSRTGGGKLVASDKDHVAAHIVHCAMCGYAEFYVD